MCYKQKRQQLTPEISSTASLEAHLFRLKALERIYAQRDLQTSAGTSEQQLTIFRNRQLKMSDLKTAFELELHHAHSTARTRERLSPE